MNTASIRDYVLQECRRSENVFGASFFDQHLAVVAEYADCLAQRLGANREVVELAAWLHDISAVRDARTLADHARISAEQAGRLLAEHGYPANLIERVVRSIASHSAPVQMGSGSPEEICVSNADAIAQIVRPAYWFYCAFAVRKLSFEEGQQWLLERWGKNWVGLVHPAKELVGDRYHLITSVVGSRAGG